MQPGSAPTAALQRDLVRAYPNVTSIDVREVLTALRDVLDNAMRGVTIVGGITMLGGVLILIGAVSMTKFQRLYESAIYRTLGAGTRLLAAMTAIEYGVIGALAGLIGAAGAAALSWAVATKLFEIEWQFTPGTLLGGVALTALVVSGVGVAASADVLVNKPLATLRRE
jgi:putative ABC transport system permease protein